MKTPCYYCENITVRRGYFDDVICGAGKHRLFYERNGPYKFSDEECDAYAQDKNWWTTALLGWLVIIGLVSCFIGLVLLS